MGHLTDGAAKNFGKLSKRAYVPEWYTSVAAGGAIVVVGTLLVVNLVAPLFSDDEAPIATGPTVTTTDTPTTGTDPSVAPTTDPTTIPSETPTGNSTEMVPLAGPGGTTELVPAAANEQATLAAAALYTSNYSGVNLPTGYSPPVGASSPGAKVVSLSVESIEPVAIEFKAEVDINGAGDIRSFPLTLVIENGVWVYYPPGT